MSENNGGGGGFGWFLLGGLIGLVAGAYIASGPGRGQVDNLRSKTIELSTSEPVQRAKEAAQRAQHRHRSGPPGRQGDPGRRGGGQEAA